MTTNGNWKVTRLADLPERWFSLPGRRVISLSLDPVASAVAAVCDDGTLWVGGGIPFRVSGVPVWEINKMVRLDQESDWKEVHFCSWSAMVGVTRHGVLRVWKRSFSPQSGDFMIEETPSRYSVWLAVSPYVGRYFENSFIALSGDGNLCYWDNNQSDWSAYPDDFVPGNWSLLQRSRIKARTIAVVRR